MYISFQRGTWDETELTHAYTYRFPYTNRFMQRDDCIENPENPAMADGFDYLSVMTRKPFPLGTTVTTRCSFTGMAAPLLIFSEDLELCEDGCYRYGNYFEVVLYKKGINVWRLWRDEDGTVRWHKRLGVEFPVSEGEVHTLFLLCRGIQPFSTRGVWYDIGTLKIKKEVAYGNHHTSYCRPRGSCENCFLYPFPCGDSVRGENRTLSLFRK